MNNLDFCIFLTELEPPFLPFLLSLEWNVELRTKFEYDGNEVYGNGIFRDFGYCGGSIVAGGRGVDWCKNDQENAVRKLKYKTKRIINKFVSLF